jgi:hypothetical protein
MGLAGLAVERDRGDAIYLPALSACIRLFNAEPLGDF